MKVRRGREREDKKSEWKLDERGWTSSKGIALQLQVTVTEGLTGSVGGFRSFNFWTISALLIKARDQL
jgi:hypothetical protein